MFPILGTNNARLAAMLRQLAQYHAKDPNNLFMVRLAQVKHRCGSSNICGALGEPRREDVTGL